MIEARNLTMHYGVTMALDNVSFSANEKEVLGLLGPKAVSKNNFPN